LPFRYSGWTAPCRRHFVPLLRYDLLVRKNKAQFFRRPTAKSERAFALRRAVRPGAIGRAVEPLALASQFDGPPRCRIDDTSLT
jgi:hypothetical protein